MATASLETTPSTSLHARRRGSVLLWVLIWVIYEAVATLLLDRSGDGKHLLGPVLFGAILGAFGASLGEKRAATKTGGGLVLYWSLFWAALHGIYCTSMLMLFYFVATALHVNQQGMTRTLLYGAAFATASGAIVGLVGGFIRSRLPSRATESSALADHRPHMVNALDTRRRFEASLPSNSD